MKIDQKKFRQSFLNEIKRIDREGIKRLPAKDRQGIGEDTIEAMKELIAKGLSPIAGWGRFPGYKAVEKVNKIQKVGRGIKNEGRRARIRAKVRAAKKRGYPYNVMDKFPGKRVRPVNLFLSGDFLRALQAKAIRKGFEIGFYKGWASKYEDGHRKGANKQPKRPIIPDGGEEFNQVVYQAMLRSLRFRLIPFLAKVARRG